MTVETIEIAPVAIGAMILATYLVATTITSVCYAHRINTLERVVKIKARQVQRLRNMWEIR